MQNEKHFFSEISNKLVMIFLYHNALHYFLQVQDNGLIFVKFIFVLMVKFYVNADLVILDNIFHLMLQSQLYHCWGNF